MAEEPSVKGGHPFPEATVAFAVDVSESTNAETLQAERTFTRKVAVQLGFQSRTTGGRLLLRTQDEVISSSVKRKLMSLEIDPLDIFDTVSAAGPARPSMLFQDDAARNTLLNSTIWFLMTNGEVEESERMAFEQGLTKSTVHGTPCVTVKFGKTTSMPTNTELGLSRSVFDMCPNSLILFYDIESRNIMIMRSKGIFNTLLKGIECPTIEAKTIWFEFPRFEYKDLAKVKVPPPFILAEDEVILEDSSGSFRFGDLLANRLDDDMMKTIISNPNNLHAVLKLAQLQSDSEEFRAWAQNEMWDYDDCLWKPRVDIEEQAKIAFLRLSEAITEARDQDTVDTLKCALREAHASNLEGFHESCRQVETLRRYIIRGVLRSNPDSIIPAGPPEWVASLDAECSAESPYPDGVMGWHALLWNPGFAAETETPHLGTCSICGVTNANLNLMFKTPPTSTIQPDAYPKYSAGDNVESEWPWKVGYATENEVLCTSVCCCGPCSTHCLSLGFAGIEDKLTSAWPIGQYLRNEDVYRMQLEQIFGRRVDPALAPVVFLSVLLKARKGAIDSGPDLIQLSGTTVEDTLRKAVSRVIADLIQGIETKSDGLPPRPSEKDGMPRPSPVKEFAPAYKVAGRHELDDEPILDSQLSFANTEPVDETRLTLQERLPIAIKALNGRLTKPGHFLHGFSLPAFTAAFEAACVALGPDATEPAWAANLHVAALKRYLFRLTEGVWALGAKDRRRWTLTRNTLKNLVESYMELMKTIPPATIVGTPLLDRVDWELVCGMRCYRDIEEALEQATTVFLQEVVGMDEKDFSCISDQQWTVETLFTKVFSRPQVAKILKEVGGDHLQEEEEEQVEAALVKKDDVWETQAEETQAEETQGWGGGGWGPAAENAPAEEGHDDWGPSAEEAPSAEAQDCGLSAGNFPVKKDTGWGPAAEDAPVKGAQDRGPPAENPPVKENHGSGHIAEEAPAMEAQALAAEKARADRIRDLEAELRELRESQGLGHAAEKDAVEESRGGETAAKKAYNLGVPAEEAVSQSPGYGLAGARASGDYQPGFGPLQNHRQASLSKPLRGLSASIHASSSRARGGSHQGHRAQLPRVDEVQAQAGEADGWGSKDDNGDGPVPVETQPSRWTPGTSEGGRAQVGGGFAHNGPAPGGRADEVLQAQVGQAGGWGYNNEEDDGAVKEEQVDEWGRKPGDSQGTSSLSDWW